MVMFMGSQGQMYGYPKLGAICSATKHVMDPKAAHFTPSSFSVKTVEEQQKMQLPQSQKTKTTTSLLNYPAPYPGESFFLYFCA
eukprot:UN13331